MTGLHHNTQERRQPSMADVWNDFPGAPGALVPAVAHGIAQHAPLAPLHLHAPTYAPADAALPADAAQVDGYRDTAGWSAIKHCMQLAFVASVLLLVLSGGDSPLMALAYVATGLLLMATMVLTDRQMFQDADGDGFTVEVAQPLDAAPLSPHAQHLQALEAAQRHGFHVGVPGPVRSGDQLRPLLEQMQVVMPDRVDVT